MSIDLYIVMRDEPSAVTPSRLGLGTALYPWPDADSTKGWHYDDCHVKLSVSSIDELRESFSEFDSMMPAGAKSSISFTPYWYTDNIENTFASALAGLPTSDAELAEGPYENEDDASGPPSWPDAPSTPAIDRARALLFADRYRPRAELLDPIGRAALDGDAGARAVVKAWLERAAAKVYGEIEGRRADLDIIRAALPTLAASFVQ